MAPPAMLSRIYQTLTVVPWLLALAAALTPALAQTRARVMLEVTATLTDPPLVPGPVSAVRFGEITLAAQGGGRVILPTDGSEPHHEGAVLRVLGAEPGAIPFTGPPGLRVSVVMPDLLEFPDTRSLSYRPAARPVVLGDDGTATVILGGVLEIAPAAAAGAYATTLPVQVVSAGHGGS